MSGYLILLADGLHGISDIAEIALLMYSGFIARKPSDASHLLGHEMVRNVAFLVVAVAFITIIVFELFKEGIKDVVSNHILFKHHYYNRN
ncbi:MAG: cation transporter [Thermoplasmata archaeon]|nr:cation transporter [Thermoplasmata archaeon]